MAFIDQQTALLELLDTVYSGLLEPHYIPGLRNMAKSHIVSKKYGNDAAFKMTIDTRLRAQLRLDVKAFQTEEPDHLKEHQTIFDEIKLRLKTVTDYEIYALSVMDNILRDEVTVSKTRKKGIENDCRECSWPQDCWTIILNTTNAQKDSPFTNLAMLEHAYLMIYQAGIALCQRDSTDFLQRLEGYRAAIEFSLNNDNLKKLPDSQKKLVESFLTEVQRLLLPPAHAKASTFPAVQWGMMSLFVKKSPSPDPSPPSQGHPPLLTFKIYY